MIQYLVFVGAAINLVGSSFYIRSTLRGTTKPNRVTWLFWSLAPLIASIAAFSDGVRLAAVPVFMSGFMPLLVFLSSFVNPKAYWRLGVFDYFCGFFALLGLVLWAATREPAAAIALAVVSDGFAAIPTLVKSWTFPDTESSSAYIAGFLSASSAFAAIQYWHFSEFAFPLYLVIANSALIFAVYRKRLFGIPA